MRDSPIISQVNTNFLLGNTDFRIEATHAKMSRNDVFSARHTTGILEMSVASYAGSYVLGEASVRVSDSNGNRARSSSADVNFLNMALT